MFCPKCGTDVGDGKFCPNCGNPMGGSTQNKMPPARIERSTTIQIKNWQNENRKVISEAGCFRVIEHQKDLSVGKLTAMNEYFLSKMNVRRRQIEISLNNSAVTIQAGALQVLAGDIVMETTNLGGGVKGVLTSAAKSIATNETISKPTYYGTGTMILEPTYKHIIFQEVSDWGDGGLVVEDGMFLGCEETVKLDVISNTKGLATKLISGEGIFNSRLTGEGIVALESFVPMEELVVIELNDDVLKLDGSMAVCWSGSLDFRTEIISRGVVDSFVSGEGFMNVYRGTGKVWMTPVSGTKGSAPKEMASSGTADSAIAVGKGLGELITGFL